MNRAEIVRAKIAVKRLDLLLDTLEKFKGINDMTTEEREQQSSLVKQYIGAARSFGDDYRHR